MGGGRVRCNILFIRCAVGIIVISIGSVVSRGTVVNGVGGGLCYVSNKVVENIHQKDKQSGGEGATLLDTGVKVNTSGVGPVNSGKTVGVVEESLNGVTGGGGETDSFDDSKNRLVTTRVEGFFEINKHDVVKLFVLESTVEFFIEKFYVAINGHVFPKPVLVR